MTKLTPPAAAPRPRRLISRALAALLAAALLLAPACSNDDSSAASSDSDSDDSTTSRPTTTTTETSEHAASEGAQLRQDVQAALTAYDEVIGQILADPGVASDRDHPLYAQLRALMTPGNTSIDAVINALVAAGGRGERQVPEGSHQLPVERRLTGRFESVESDQYIAIACTYLNYRVFDSRGEPLSVVEGYIESSRVTLQRVGGDLRIEGFESVEDGRCAEGER